MVEKIYPYDPESLNFSESVVSEELRDVLSTSREFQEAFKALKESKERKWIIEYLLGPLEQNERFVLAVSIAQKKPWYICRYFEYFQPLQDEQRFKIAEKIACTDGVFLVENFEKFGINSEEDRFELVSKMLEKTEEEYKKDFLLNPVIQDELDPVIQDEGEAEKIAIAEAEAGQLVFTVHKSVKENFDDLGITTPEYKEQIRNKLIEEVKKD